MTDHDLIHDFTVNRSEQAFRRLVDRHCDLVYSVASRVTRDVELARDVAQQVFCKLAAKPHTVPQGVPLAAWLHRNTRSLAIDLVRSEEARRKREANHSSAMNSDPTPDWSRLEPVIDSLIDELPELERRAVVLRFYEKKSHGAIGGLLGLSEEATRKRLDRALEKLRGLLAKRGIVTSAVALAVILPAHATAPAPAGLSASVSSSALSTAGLTAAQTTSIIAIIMNYKVAIAGVSLLLLAGVTAVAVSKNPEQNAPPQVTASAPAPEAFREKSKSNTTYSHLEEKYGEPRTKLAARLAIELAGLREDSFAGMEIFRRMEPTQNWEDPEMLFGDVGQKLVLTKDQMRKMVALATEAIKRRSEEDRKQLETLKKESGKVMELMLAGDALKRGEISQAGYDALDAGIGLRAAGIELDVEVDDMRPLEDLIYKEDVRAILDAGQAEIFQQNLVALEENEKRGKEYEALLPPAFAAKFGPKRIAHATSLEDYEQELKAARKKARASLKILESHAEETRMQELERK